MSLTPEFYTQLTSGPAFLFLGQDYLKAETGSDPFLAELLRKYGGDNGEKQRGYYALFDSQANEAGEAALAWMHERCNRLSAPASLQIIANYPWSGVYTTAIDCIWINSFRKSWRDLHRLYQEKYYPSDPRSRTRLHLTFLFGSVDRVEHGERPPLSKLEWYTRKHTAIALAERLPELVTPLGILVFEGYEAKEDWLPPENLYPVLQKLTPGQAHIFSASEALLQDEILHELIKEGQVVVHEASLAACLAQGEQAGYIRLGQAPEDERLNRHIHFGGGVHEVPLNLWNQVSRSARILDDTIHAALPSLSEDRLYHEFRKFLASSGTQPVWTGYARGFPFRRSFERKLQRKTWAELNTNQLQEEPVIVHGATGTGKTIALGALAYEVREKGEHPVLFIERKAQKPRFSDIDAFCQWAENHGAPKTLVIWDGMQDEGDYYGMLKSLGGRGRKLVLVGSLYQITDQARFKKSNYVEAPKTFEDEFDDFIRHLNHLDQQLGNAISRILLTKDNYFLVALYRLLPVTRSRLREGLLSETLYVEQKIAQGVQTTTVEPDNVLAAALQRAGIIGTPQSEVTEEVGSEEVNRLQQLVGLTMVPGQFGLHVPIELLLRTLYSTEILDFVNLIKQYDLFTWAEDAMGNIAIGPRHALEARLIVQARLGGPKTEVAFACKLILEVRGGAFSPEEAEIQFAVDLVRSIGPNSERAGRFAPFWLEIANTLGALYRERGVQHPRLMLQEANLIREYVIWRSRFPDSDQEFVTTSTSEQEDPRLLLSEAELILDNALQLVEETRGDKLKGILYAEKAALIGAEITYLLNQANEPQEALSLYKHVRELVYKSLALDSDNYPPADILAWVTLNLVKLGEVNSIEQAQLEADFLHMFSVIDEQDLNSHYRVSYYSRYQEVTNVLGRTDLSEQAFQQLREMGSGAGYYLRAYHIVGHLPSGEELSSKQVKRCKEAVEYLEQNYYEIRHDARTLYLWLRLWWMMRTHKPLFYRERQAVPFTQDNWQYAYNRLEELEATGEAYDVLRIRYLKALALFHLGDLPASFELFNELARETNFALGRRRIYRSYLASTSTGSPQVFTGDVANVMHDNSRGEVYVNELRQKITFRPLDFNRPDIRRSEPLGDFYIAFNFLGPIADPTRFYDASQQRG